MKCVLNFLKDESGPTAVEYAVMLGLIIMAAIASITLFGQKNQATMESVGTALPE